MGKSANNTTKNGACGPIKDPIMRRFVEELNRLPEFIAERRERRIKKMRFALSVFDQVYIQVFGPIPIIPGVNDSTGNK